MRGFPLRAPANFSCVAKSFVRNRHSAGKLVRQIDLVDPETESETGTESKPKHRSYFCREVPHRLWPSVARGLNSTLASILSQLLPIQLQSVETQFDRINMERSLPDSLRGMKTLDKSAFRKTVQVPALKVPVRSIGVLSKTLRKSLLHALGVKNIADLATKDPNHRLFLLDPNKHQNVDSFTAEEQKMLEQYGVDMASWSLYDLEMTYENWGYNEILKAILPKDSDSVAGYSLIGHILHLNLRDELLEYKEIIGQVLLDKVSSAKTIVNKSSVIDNTFRNFEMEVLAGEPDLLTTAKENGFSYYFDFSKVYWNPRLSTEHERIVRQVKRSDVVYDVFAGVGPFAIPAAKKGCVVHANDLNPESYRWLQHNVTLNKIKTEVHSYNLDGREFIRSIVKKDLLDRWQQQQGDQELDVSYKMHIVMNLPALAIEFLDTFPGLLASVDPDSLVNVVLPTVHCYCFSKAEDSIQDAKDMASQALGQALPPDCQVRHVRNVAPNKDMMCVIFQLQKHVLLGQAQETLGEVEVRTAVDTARETVELQETDEDEPPPEKRAREDNC